MPAAEVDVSAVLVRRLLAEQQPDLAGLPAELMANGWDNVLFRLGGDLVARLPRREMSAGLVAHEQRWLPMLAQRLPLPIPAPVRTGRPGLGYPWPWSIVPFLPGTVAAADPPADPRDAAVRLGAFLAALHTPAPPDAPLNRFRGVPLAARTTTVMENLDLASGQVARPAALRVWEAALAAPRWDRPPVWLHGDLHPANVLVHRGRVSGVIDFGDITSGDPAIDLAIGWMLLPGGCRGAFRDSYAAAGGCAASDAIWDRAHGWALALSLVFLAHSADNRQMYGIGQRTMREVLG
jgi:aminoglycoside phosphotransferase (APT) family kinase protein